MAYDAPSLKSNIFKLHYLKSPLNNGDLNVSTDKHRFIDSINHRKAACVVSNRYAEHFWTQTLTNGSGNWFE